MIKTLICIDRDGTLIFDKKEHLYLGRDDEWRSNVRILPHVIEGLTILRTVPNSAVYMITNQPGVAIADFPLLTMERAHEVCQYVIDKIRSTGGHMNGYFLCPHANHDYVKRYGKRYHFNEDLVCECDCIKPGLGMVFDALRSEGVTREGVSIYVIGDRATDVETALNIGGTGILIPFENQPGEDDKVRELPDQSDIYIAKNLREAGELMIQHHSRNGND
jgi:histidinol-phosphate phosphatase family protein